MPVRFPLCARTRRVGGLQYPQPRVRILPTHLVSWAPRRVETCSARDLRSSLDMNRICLAIALAVTFACSHETEPASPDQAEETIAGAIEQEPAPPPRPASCEAESDCDSACPAGARGCTCHQSPHGGVCVPVCGSDDDCPGGGPGSLRCHEGVCKPPRPPPPPACDSQQDCAGMCPPGATGCGCHRTPRGRACVPTCNDASDCPGPAGAAKPSCERGVCRPPKPPE